MITGLSPGYWSWKPFLLQLSLSSTKVLPASVLVDTEDADAVELGKLRQEDTQQGRGVDYEVPRVIFGIKTGQYVAKRKETT